MQGVQGPRAARAARGVSCRWCAAQGGGHVQLRGCVWAWRGRREARNARRARVPVAALRYRLVPPVGKPAVCVCVCLCATQPGAGCGVWVRLVRRLRGKEGRARCDATQPVVDRRLRSAACACACVRRAEGGRAARASWSHKCLRAGVGHYQRTKRKSTGAVRLGAAPRSRREARLPSGRGDERAASVNLTLTRGWCAGRAATGSYPVPSSRHRAL